MTRLDGHALPVRLYLTDEHPCAYLPGMRARTLFVDPRAHIDGRRAQSLQHRGFRRSGIHFYRPACPSCNQCVPVRVPAATFCPNRAQRRTIKRNADLSVRLLAARFVEEHYQLYEHYLAARHADGGMIDDLSRDSYRNFLLAAWGGETGLLELRQDKRLLAVAVCDLLADDLSAVYTFYDPEHSARSLGTFTILTQLAWARRQGWQALYLGYWIANCRKMAYKAQFRPLQVWDGQGWHTVAPDQPIMAPAAATACACRF